MKSAGVMPLNRPWIRFWARWVDMTVFAILFGVPFVLLFDGTAVGALVDRPFVFELLGLLLWVFIEAGLVARGIRTPGKWLFRTRIESATDQPVSYMRALRRSAGVWWYGMAAGIPLLSQFANLNAFNYLQRNHETHWDRMAGFVVKHERIGAMRFGMAISLIAGTMAMLFAVQGGLVGPGAPASATVEDAGLYEEADLEKVARSASWMRQYVLIEGTTVVVAEPAGRFGARFRVNLLADSDAMATGKLRIRWIFPEPGLKDPSASRARLRAEHTTTVRDGELLPCMFVFDHPWEQVPGRWVVELWQENDKLAEQVFEVVLAQSTRA